MYGISDMLYEINNTIIAWYKDGLVYKMILKGNDSFINISLYNQDVWS